MISSSGLLKPKAVAGRPSVTRFTQRSCTGINASGIPKHYKGGDDDVDTTAALDNDGDGDGAYSTDGCGHEDTCNLSNV